MTTAALPTMQRDLELEAIVHDWVRRPERWSHLVHFAEPRVRIPLHADARIEVRLLTWLPGQASGLHDHGGSAGVLTVVAGTIWETVVDRSGGVSELMHRVGATSSFRHDIIHSVQNLGDEGAITLHAYRPPTTIALRYERIDGGLRVVEG